jgi:hypothetical protein
VKIIPSKFILFVFIFAHSLQEAHGADKNNLQVIAHEKGAKKSSWQLKSDSGFLVSYDDTDQKGEKFSATDLIITYKNGKLFLNDRKNDHQKLMIASQSGTILFEGKSYSGSLIVVREKKRIVISYEGIEEPHQIDDHKKQENSIKSVKVARQKSNDFTVRVLIEEQDIPASSWKLSSKKGFMLCNPLEPSKKQRNE